MDTLGAGEDDGFFEVLDHEGDATGRETHGVSAVQNDESVVI